MFGVAYKTREPAVIGLCKKGNLKVWLWQQVAHFFWPLGHFQSRSGKDVTHARFVPFVGVFKAVKIKMPDGPALKVVRLEQGIGRTFDASMNATGPKKMAHQRCFPGAQVPAQADKAVARSDLLSQLPGKQSGGALIRPGLGFYNGPVEHLNSIDDGQQWVGRIQQWARALGFSQIGVADIDLSQAEPGLSAWLAQGFHGQMHYMAAHGLKRARPAELVAGTVSVITARMDYLPETVQADPQEEWQSIHWRELKVAGQGYVSVYARGRDYHRVLRARLQQLAERMTLEMGPLGFRVFTDSAPVLEVELGARSGLGWRGKHTLLLDRQAGSMFFLGEIYIDRILPRSEPTQAHCGSCEACLAVCPTQAIIAPFRLDARRCLSYLSIEHEGAIPLEFRRAMGNRIYGCDDCQLVCPWNKYAKTSALPDFARRSIWQSPELCDLFAWSEAQFLDYTQGSAIRRIGYERWQRNLAVALGNALQDNQQHAQDEVSARARKRANRGRYRTALHNGIGKVSAMVDEHIGWALACDNESVGSFVGRPLRP